MSQQRRQEAIMTFFVWHSQRHIYRREWSSYRGSLIYYHVMEVVTLMEGERSSYRGSLMNDHVTEVVTLMEGERSCYRDGQ